MDLRDYLFPELSSKNCDYSTIASDRTYGYSFPTSTGINLDSVSTGINVNVDFGNEYDKFVWDLWNDYHESEKKINTARSTIGICDEICLMNTKKEKKDMSRNTIKGTTVVVPEITNVQVFNNRAVKVTFADGSWTRSVAEKEEVFSLYIGVEICIFKRMLGKDDGSKIYNKIMKNAFDKIDKIEREKNRAAEERKKDKERKHKAELKRQAKALKKKEELINIQKEAYLRALNEHEKGTIERAVFDKT